MTKSKLEKVLEHMVNDEMDLANDMLHEHIVEAAREIYADLAEEDDLAEAELELDEDLDEGYDEDLDEGYDESDASGDFENDIETMEDEVEAEEYFSEEDDEDEAMDDLEGEMDMDIDDELADGDMDDMGGETDVEDAMVNVEDALDELRAAFADMMDDDMDDDMGDEVADEFGDDEMDMDGEELEESATLKAHGKVTMAGDDDGKASPVAKKKSDMSDGHAKPVKFADGAEEKGGKGDSAKKMTVTGPQDQGGKFDKSVAKPGNSSEKSTSTISGK